MSACPTCRYASARALDSRIYYHIAHLEADNARLTADLEAISGEGRELDALRGFHERFEPVMRDGVRQLGEARAERDRLRAALPNPAKLDLLADWVDLRYPNDPDPQVQADLRRWARNIRAALAQPSDAERAE